MHILCPHCRNPIEIVKLTPREELSCPSCGSSFFLEGESTTAERGPGQKVGRFELVEAVGQGAFGTVYKARDPELDRTVAIKVPRSGNLAGAQELDRFLREARSVAQLRHPSIVTVHEVGQTEGVPYLVSDFVEGITLADLLTARRPSFREAAELIASVAEALQYAHERGVVHRDIKPSNIMIGEDGKPCVMDFGLAKRDAGEITMTMEGQVLGTPAYMSPEQARGEGHDVDGRSDVYSLGVILYQLLTGELPFRGTKRMLLHQVLQDEPRPPRSLNDHIPRDLETICLKAMAKEPQRRYATAQELADDLRRWLNGDAIKARPVGRAERLVRWAKRSPAAAALVVVSGVAALAVVGLAVGLVYHAQLQTAYRAEEEERKKVEEALGVAEEAKKGEQEQRKKAEHIGYLHSIFLAGAALRENNVFQARRLLDQSKEELRGWEWHHLNGQCHAELFSLRGGTPVFSPDGTRLAVLPPLFASGGKIVRVYDVRTGREVFAVNGSGGGLGVRFSPDGERLAVVASGGRQLVGLFDVRTGQAMLAPEEAGRLREPMFTPDGARFAVTSTDDGEGRVDVFDVHTMQQLVSIKTPGKFGETVFSPDGTRIAIAPPPSDGEGAVRVFDAGKGQELLAVENSAKFSSVTFSPDGARLILSGSGHGVVRVVDVRTGEDLFSIKGGAGPRLPRFSADGRQMATAFQGGIRVSDAETGQEVCTLKAPGGGLLPHFSPDGTRIALVPARVIREDSKVRVHDARTGQELFTVERQGQRSGVEFSPDGMRLALVDDEGVVRVHDGWTGEEPFVLRGPVKLNDAVFSPNGALLAAGGVDGNVHIFDARHSHEAVPFKVSTWAAAAVFSPDGTRLLVFPIQTESSDDKARVFDSRSGQMLFTLRDSARFSTVAFSQDGTRIVVGPILSDTDGVVRVFDARNGKELLALRGPGKLAWPKFSPDGERIAVGQDALTGGNGMVRVFDARTGQELLALAGPPRLGPPVFSPDGSQIAATDGDGVVRIFDARDGKELRSLKGPGKLSTPVFSPDGAHIAAFPTGDGTVQVFDARDGREVLSLKVPVKLRDLVFSPAGDRIAVSPSTAGAGDGVVRVFDVRTGQKLPALSSPAALIYAVFSPDGTRLATDGRDGVVRLWDAGTGQEVCNFKAPTPLQHPVFSPDGARLAVGGNDGVVRVFEAPRDIPAWLAQRRQALMDGVAGWHREQADASAQRRQWFAVAFHLGRVIEAEPENGTHYLRRGQALAAQGEAAKAREDFEKALGLADRSPELDRAEIHIALGQWDAAAKFYARAVEAPDASPEVWERHVLLRLHLGGRQAYTGACKAMLKRFEETQSPAVAHSVAWVCALAPGALEDLEPAVKLARIAAVPRVRRPVGGADPLGAILYRAGQDKEAVTKLVGASAVPCLFLAMAHHRLGDADESREWMERAVLGSNRNPPVTWHERLELQLLRREAEQVLQAKPGKP